MIEVPLAPIPLTLAQPYMRDGEPHYWSGAAPWRPEVYGGDEPVEPNYDGAGGLNANTPGPGAYATPAFLCIGR